MGVRKTLVDPRWGIYPQENGDVVVLPLDDKQEHDALSKECPCMPKIEIINSRLVITHNAFDFRHVAEWLEENNEHTG